MVNLTSITIGQQELICIPYDNKYDKLQINCVIYYNNCPYLELNDLCKEVLFSNGITNYDSRFIIKYDFSHRVLKVSWNFKDYSLSLEVIKTIYDILGIDYYAPIRPSQYGEGFNIELVNND